MIEQAYRNIWSKPPTVSNGPFNNALIGRRDRNFEIAYAGNSVTAQRQGYQAHLHDHLKQKWSCQTAPIRVALGAVGSIGLASYWSALIRDRRPEVVFLECSTADIGGATPVPDIRVALGHLVHAFQKLGSRICFLYLPRTDRLASRRSEILRVYEHVAEDLGVPSIDLEFRDDLENPELYLYDGVHTTPLGAALIADAIVEALQNQERKHSIVSYRKKELVHAESNLIVHSWQRMSYESVPRVSNFRLGIPFAEINCDSSATWASPDSSLIGLQILLGSHSGVIELRSDKKSRMIQTWDETCERNPRLSYLPIPIDFRTSNTITFTALRSVSGQRDLYGARSHTLHSGTMMRVIGCTEEFEARHDTITLEPE